MTARTAILDYEVFAGGTAACAADIAAAVRAGGRALDASGGARVLFLGATPGTVAAVRTRYEREFPNLHVAGVRSAPRSPGTTSPPSSPRSRRPGPTCSESGSAPRSRISSSTPSATGSRCGLPPRWARSSTSTRAT
jgi:hypothetical protein